MSLSYFSDSCYKLPDIINIIKRDIQTEFPVNHGQVIRIKCESGYSLVGDDEIICLKGNTYSYDFTKKPECKLGE